jgi:hypothetical protein
MRDELDEFLRFVQIASLRRGFRVGGLERLEAGAGRVAVYKGLEVAFVRLSGPVVDVEGPAWADGIAEEVDADVNRDLFRFAVLA